MSPDLPPGGPHVEEWHTPQVNKHHVWQGYVDSYGNHAFGVIQENGQNSFDAYPEGTNPSAMKVVMHYDAEARCLSWRDFGARGMPHCEGCTWGILPDGKECTNPSCPWGTFHNMGYSGKGGTDLGSRGMGKALQLLSGTRTVVRTTLPDGRYQASVWERVGRGGDWQWRIAAAEAKPLSATGLALTTEGVIPRVHDQLLDAPAMVAELQERWFRLISQGATVEYVLTKNGKSERFVVREPRPPALDESQGPEKARRVDAEVVVTLQGTRLGVIRNLHLFLAKAPFGEEDRRAGIAIVKNGKQTIARFRDFPDEIPESIRNRVFGYCDAITTADEPFLKDAENATHTGYQWSNPTYKAARRVLREITKQFVQPFLRAGGERVSEADQREARDILEVLNLALADVPEFGFFGRESVGSKRKVTTVPKNFVYLSRLDFENRSYKRGEKAIVASVVKNPTAKPVSVTSVFTHFDPTPVAVQLTPDSAIVPAGTPERPGTATMSCQILFDPSQAPGIHWIQVVLQDVKRVPLVDDEGQPIIGRRHIYCEFEPQKMTRTRSGSGSPSEGSGPGGGEGALGLSGMQFFNKPDMVDTLEAYIDQSQAVAFVNRHGRRFDFAKEGAKSRKAHWPMVGEIVGEELLKIRAALDAETRETWSSEDFKNKVVELENTKAKLVRRMTQLVS